MDENISANEAPGLGTGHAPGTVAGQPKILEYLAEYGEHEQKDIATYREIEPATVGSILLRMETAGLIARRNRPDNRRSLYVSLTPKGFTTLSMGNWIIIIFSLYIVLQFVLQGKNFQPWRILQLICTTLFGYFTDFTNLLAEMFLPDPALMTFAPAVVYGVRLLYLFISMALIALGILLYLAPDLLSLPGEGIMQVMAAKAHQPLPVVKMCFDCTISIIALILSLVYFRQFHGIREGDHHRRLWRGQNSQPLRAPEAGRASLSARRGSAVIPPLQKRRALFPTPLRCPCAAHEPMGGACLLQGFSPSGARLMSRLTRNMPPSASTSMEPWWRATTASTDARPWPLPSCLVERKRPSLHRTWPL